MRIAVITDPSNFHTQKWSKALQAAGAEVLVFSYSDAQIEGVPCVQVEPPKGLGANLNYAWYLFGGKNLRKALKVHEIDVVNPINVTPFGVWVHQAGFQPVVSIAMGADILEYPPKNEGSPLLDSRSWSNIEGSASSYHQLKHKIASKIFRFYVQQALQSAQLITADNWVLVDAVSDWFGIDKKKVKLNRWGIEQDLFDDRPATQAKMRKKFGIQEGQKVVLSPRGAKAIYQADIILAAFEKLLEAGRQEKYIMFSAGYEVAEAVRSLGQKLAAKYPNFHFQEDLIPREEMYELWPLVDVFVSAPIYDGYSNAVGEGRYIGAVPVVNQSPATLEIFEHQKNGWIVEPFDAQNLASALTQILHEFELWQPTFHQANKPWMLEHSVLEANIAQFVKDCEAVLADFHQKKHSSF